MTLIYLLIGFIIGGALGDSMANDRNREEYYDSLQEDENQSLADIANSLDIIVRRAFDQEKNDPSL